MAWGITGGLGIATGVFAIVTVSSESSLEDLRESGPADPAELDSASTETTAFAAITDALLVGTVIAAGISIYLTIDAVNEADQSGPSTGVRLSPNGIRLEGTF